MYQESTYCGDEIYTVNCTGDCVVGDEVCFEKATFSGSFRNATFDGFVKIEGIIIKDSYGKDKQQHTFTIKLLDGKTMRIKGRNLYANGTYRKRWSDESLREISLNEKHIRGEKARAVRQMRKESNIYY